MKALTDEFLSDLEVDIGLDDQNNTSVEEKYLILEVAQWVIYFYGQPLFLSLIPIVVGPYLDWKFLSSHHPSFLISTAVRFSTGIAGFDVFPFRDLILRQINTSFRIPWRHIIRRLFFIHLIISSCRANLLSVTK